MPGDYYKQAIPDLSLSIEKDTGAVPSDGEYHVLKDGVVIASFRSLKQAQGLFKKIVLETGYKPKTVDGETKSASEMAMERYMEAKEFYWADSYKHRGGGGKGGRGGV